MNPFNFLAKSNGVKLHEHTEHVELACKNLLNSLPISVEEKSAWLPVLKECAVLHDIGKAHLFFQKNLQSKRPVYAIRHEVISLWICTTFLRKVSDEQLFAIATHHKGVMDNQAEDAGGRLSSVALNDMLLEEHIPGDLALLQQMPEFLETWNTHFKTEFQIQTQVPERLNEAALPRQVLWLLNKDFQKRARPDAVARLRLAETRALLIGADHIGSARREEDLPEWKRLEPEVFKPKGFDFRAFQKRLLEVKDDVLLYAPTGSGKTEAALCWLTANQQPNARFLYLLPYTASINAMTTRLEKIFGQKRVTALHSKTLDFFYERLEAEEDNFDEAGEFERNIERRDKAKSLTYLSKELFYPVKVATPHQLLRFALMGKGWEMGLFDFRNACVVVDEFHAYEPLLTGLMLASIRWLKCEYFEAKVFFMSATIPKFLQDLIVDKIFDGDISKLRSPSPDEPSDRIVLDQKRHKVFCLQGRQLDQQIGEIEQLLEAGKSVLVVVNNVKTCQTIFEKIKFDGYKKMLHSGFHRIDRQEIEKAITHDDPKERPQLLVATQAVEVSLDIDYNVAFMENAPIDALIQRFGRVNRKGTLENETGEKVLAPIFLFEKIIGKTPFYDDAILGKTWAAMTALQGQDLSELDLVEACNLVYKEGYTVDQWKDFNQGFEHPKITGFFQELIAGDWRDWIEDAIESNNKKLDVLCENLLPKFRDFKNKGDYIRASQLLVSVNWYEVKDGLLPKDKKLGVRVARNLEYLLKDGSDHKSEIGYKKKVESLEDQFL